MPIITCKTSNHEMIIDEPNGEAYITYADGSISCTNFQCGEQQTPVEGEENGEVSE